MPGRPGQQRHQGGTGSPLTEREQRLEDLPGGRPQTPQRGDERVRTVEGERQLTDRRRRPPEDAVRTTREDRGQLGRSQAGEPLGQADPRHPPIERGGTQVGNRCPQAGSVRARRSTGRTPMGMRRLAVRAAAVLVAVGTTTGLAMTPAAAVAHGTPAAAGQFPFAVKLTMTAITRANGTSYDSGCSAALISRTWILTAGHCFHDVNGVRVSGATPYRTTATLNTA